MPRLIFVNRFFYPDHSATSQMLGDLAFRLAHAGREVIVVCSRQLYDDADANLPPREHVDGVEVWRVGATRRGRSSLAGRAVDYLTFHVSTAWRLWRLLRSGDIVVAKTDPPLLGVTVAAAARLRGARLVNWLQDVFPEVATRLGVGGLPSSVTRALTTLRDASLRAASCNVAIGTLMARYLLSRGLPAHRVTVIENWADARFVHPLPAASSQLRRELGLLDSFVVGHSGNLGRAHDVETLLSAAHSLRDLERVVFLIIGGGAGYLQLHDRVRAAGLQDRFRFLPYQPRERLADSLAAADVHLASLREELEGLIVPSKFYGVIAAGRPLIFIGHAQGEIALRLRDAACGLTAPAGAPEALAQSIRTLHDSPVEVAAMGARAAALHRERHTAEIAAQRWQQLFSELEAGVDGVGAGVGAADGRVRATGG